MFRAEKLPYSMASRRMGTCITHLSRPWRTASDPRVDGGRRVTMTCWCGFADAKACGTGVRNDGAGRSPASGAEDTWELSVLSVQFG